MTGATDASTNDVDDLINRCTQLRANGKENDSIRVCSQLIAATTSSKLLISAALLNRGRAYGRQGLLSLALADYSLAINEGAGLNDQSVLRIQLDTIVWTSAVEFRMNGKDAGSERLGLALALLAKSAEMLVQPTSATVATSEGDYDDDLAERVIRQGQLHLALGNWTEAIVTFDRMITEVAKASPELRTYAWLMKACACHGRDDRLGRILSLEAACQLEFGDKTLDHEIESAIQVDITRKPADTSGADNTANDARGVLPEELIRALESFDIGLFEQVAFRLPPGRQQALAEAFARVAERQRRVEVLGLDIEMKDRKKALASVNEWFSVKARENAFANAPNDAKETIAACIRNLCAELGASMFVRKPGEKDLIAVHLKTGENDQGKRRFIAYRPGGKKTPVAQTLGMPELFLR